MMTVERNTNGYWIVSAMIDDYRVQRIYGGYTKEEAVAMFREEHNI